MTPSDTKLAFVYECIIEVSPLQQILTAFTAQYWPNMCIIKLF